MVFIFFPSSKFTSEFFSHKHFSAHAHLGLSETKIKFTFHSVTSIFQFCADIWFVPREKNNNKSTLRFLQTFFQRLWWCAMWSRHFRCDARFLTINFLTLSITLKLNFLTITANIFLRKADEFREGSIFVVILSECEVRKNSLLHTFCSVSHASNCGTGKMKQFMNEPCERIGVATAWRAQRCVLKSDLFYCPIAISDCQLFRSSYRSRLMTSR